MHQKKKFFSLGEATSVGEGKLWIQTRKKNEYEQAMNAIP